MMFEVVKFVRFFGLVLVQHKDPWQNPDPVTLYEMKDPLPTKTNSVLEFYNNLRRLGTE